MTLKRTALWLTIGCVVGLILWSTRRGPQQGPEGAAPVLELERRGATANLATGEVGSAKEAEAAAVGSIPTNSGGTFSPDTPDPLAVIENLLAKPRYWPRMRDVPPIDAATEAELIRRAQRLPTMSERAALYRILAFRGGEQTVAVLTNALLHEFSGRTLGYEDSHHLFSVPFYLGIMARREPSALEFLIAGTKPDFWAESRLWYYDATAPTPRMLLGRCITSLCLTGDPAADRLLDYYRSHPEKARALRLGGDVVEGAFIRYLLRTEGLERTIDEIWYYADTRRARLRTWLETPEGRSWNEWDLGTRVMPVEENRQAP